MTAAALIADLRARGVTLVADGERLRCRPRSALSHDDLAELRSRKAQILAALRQTQTFTLTCYACKRHCFWRSVHGVVICGTCHPPATPDVVREWLDASGKSIAANREMGS